MPVISVYFAVAALEPTLAFDVAWLAVLLAMMAYLFLDWLKQGDESGLLFGLLFLLPVICLTTGILWWLLRALGFWQPLLR